MYFLLIHQFVLHAIHSKNFILSIQKVQRKHRWRFLFHLNDVFKKKKNTSQYDICDTDLKTKFLMPKICHIFLYN